VPRIAASSYLNSTPLIWSFSEGSHRHSVKLLTDTAPARCALMLARREVEAALVPVIEYQRIPELVVVPGVCVGARSRVRSVVLATRKRDIREVSSIALDTSSRTSAALIEIIFREFLRREPRLTPAEPDLAAMLQSHDAALLIGDPAMTFPRDDLRVYDLAELWREHTGLGFVFAMWMAGEEDAERIARVDFAGARDEGLMNAELIAETYSKDLGLPYSELLSYLCENICYELDEDMRAGLNLYYQLAHRHGLAQTARPLKFVDGVEVVAG